MSLQQVERIFTHSVYDVETVYITDSKVFQLILFADDFVIYYEMKGSDLDKINAYKNKHQIDP